VPAFSAGQAESIAKRERCSVALPAKGRFPVKIAVASAGAGRCRAVSAGVGRLNAGGGDHRLNGLL
jgi:hypothetical protein